jgi:hypothetical protein
MPRQRRGHDPTNPPFETLPRLPSLGGYGEDNIFLRVMAIRSAPAFLFSKNSYTLFLDTTPYIAYSILLSGIYIFALKASRKIRAGKLPLYPNSRKRAELSLVVGEAHHARNQIPSETPRWLVIPERGLFHEHSDRGCGRLWKNGKLHVPLRRADFGLSRRSRRAAHRRTHFGSERRLLRESAGNPRTARTRRRIRRNQP